MNGEFTLDSNIIIALLNNEKECLEHYQKASKIYTPSIVIGELYYAAYNSKKIASNVIKLKTFIANTLILICDEETGDFYGKIKYNLKQKAIKIPDNDIWIAALSQQFNIPLVTRDKHFDYIDNLDLVKW